MAKAALHLDDMRAATERRQAPAIVAAFGSTDVYRLVDDAADGCDGLVVDRYGDVLRLELRDTQLPGNIAELAGALCRAVGAHHAVALLRPKGGQSTLHVVHGDPPTAHVVREDGVRLLVRLTDPDAAGAGVFVDLREGRRLVRGHAAGRTVLNLFAHAGAFGAAAVAGGAARVDHVDAAKKCAPWAALNLALNGVDPRQHRFIVDDALDVVARHKKKGARYGVVICDPPTTAIRTDGSRFHVEKDLPALAATCAALLEPGGALLLSCNDRALPAAEVVDMARAAITAAGHQLQTLIEVPLPEDVPSRRDPQLRSLRGAWVTVRAPG